MGMIGNTPYLGIVSGDNILDGSVTPQDLSLYNTGTANGVAYLNGSEVLTTGSALVFDGTNLGIGTSSPAAKLNVVGATTGTAILGYGAGTDPGAGDKTVGSLTYYGHYNTGPCASIEVLKTSTPDYFNGNIIFKTRTNDAGSNTERMRLNSSGNLGLGVTPSAWGGSYKVYETPAGFIGATGTNYLFVGSNCYADAGGFKYKNTAATTLFEAGVEGFKWRLAPSGTAGNAITFTQAMTLDASGNLLVNTTSANYGAAGRGVIELGGGSTAIFAMKINNAASGYVYHDGTVMSVNNVLNGALAFATNNTERARIDSNGDVIIGAISPLATARVTVSLASNRNGIIVKAGADANYNYVGQNSAGSNTLYIYGTGNVQNTNNSYGAISDAKLKDVIGPAPSYWDKFKQYQFVNYTLKTDDAKTKLLGLVAQQAEQVSPGVVEESPDRDADGNDLGTTTKGVKYSVVTLQAEVVLQEAQARIESLEAIIEQLKSRLDAANL